MRPLQSCLAALSLLAVTTLAWAIGRQDFEGRPANFAPGAQTGAAVWTEADRLFVEFSATTTASFSGKVCSRAPLLGLKQHDLEPSDSVKVGPKQRCVWLKLSTGSRLAGFSVLLPSDTVIFDLRLGRHQLPPASIHIGKLGAHPDSSPFALPR